MFRFICPECGATAPADTLAPRCACGGLWQLDFTPPSFAAERIDRGVWGMFRYRRFLPLEGEVWRDVSLGEGMTPVVRLHGGEQVKLDFMMPTLSYKDRGAAVLIAHCKAIGVKKVVQDSSGNAGNSVAAYCARAGIACEIFVPEGTSPGKIAMIEAHGAACTVVPGSRDHCADVCRARVAEEGVYYANHVFNPLFYQGTKTYIYEIFEQLGRIPRHLVIPVGNGTLFIGAVLALRELAQCGAIDDFPQIIAVQSERCDPLLRAAAGGSAVPAEVTPTPTMAEGIAIGRPMRGAEILGYARQYGVQFVHAPEDRILAARAELAREGLFVEHTTAAGLAAWRTWHETHPDASDVLIALTGAGLKSEH